MDQETVESFLKWLDSELAKENLSDSQFAAKAKLSHTVISKARRGKLPGWDACAKIAITFQMDPMEVFRIAGLLPKVPETTQELERLKYACEVLPQKYRAVALRLIQAIPEE